jgi:regulator of protease activity HflC (stomatin/prohibitin superfamily)
MQAFDWLNDIATWFGDLVPRWDLCDPTEGGVKFKPGGVIELLVPGEIYWWWPVTTNVYTIDTKRQTLTFGQRLTTADLQEVQCNTVIVFIVDDVLAALVETRDFEDTVGEVAQKLTIKPIMSRMFEKIVRDMAESNEMRNEITRGARSLLKEYGLNVLDGYVSDFTKTKVFSHDGEPTFVGHDDEDEE